MAVQIAQCGNAESHKRGSLCYEAKLTAPADSGTFLESDTSNRKEKRMRHSSRLLHTSFALFALLALTGCPVNLDTERMPTTPPNRADLVGIYRPTADTLTYIRKEGGYAEREMSLTLKADGTFELENLPDWWHTEWGKPEGGFDSGSGQWDLEKSQDWWELNLSFTDTKRFAKPEAGRQGFGPLLIGHAAPYIIAFPFGEPDNGREMQFERAADSDGKASAKAGATEPAQPSSNGPPEPPGDGEKQPGESGE
jgi:hypothetical protein